MMLMMRTVWFDKFDTSGTGRLMLMMRTVWFDTSSDTSRTGWLINGS